MAKRKKTDAEFPKETAYRKLMNTFRSAIQEGSWPEGSAVPAQRKLGQLHGLGQRTVRLALDGLYAEGLISPSGKKRWLVKRPKGFGLRSTDYVVQVMACHLLGQLKSPDTNALHHGVEWGVAELEYPFTTLHDWHFRNHFPSANHIGLQPLKGVLLYGQIKNEVLKRYARLKVPVVLVDRPPGRRKFHSVAVDNEAAAADATRRLIEAGHRKIAFVRFVQLNLREIDEDSKERQAGFLKACKENGLTKAPEWIFNSFPNDKPDEVWLRRLLTQRPRFTAVISVSGDRAGLVEKAAQQAGLHIPRDLSIVCFQGKAVARPHFAGPCTDFFELGRRAAHLVEVSAKEPKQERMPFTWADGRTFGRIRN